MYRGGYTGVPLYILLRFASVQFQMPLGDACSTLPSVLEKGKEETISPKFR